MGQGAGNFILTILTSLGSAALTGAFFMLWINSKFGSIYESNKDLKERVRFLEEKNADLLSKDDHSAVRKEDSERIERQLHEVRKDIKEMPNQIVGMLTTVLKNFSK